MASTKPGDSGRNAKASKGNSRDRELYVEVRVPMSEVELDRVIARAKQHGVSPDEYVAGEIRAYLAKQPKPQASFLICEMKLVRSVFSRGRGR